MNRVPSASSIADNKINAKTIVEHANKSNAEQVLN